MSVSSLHNTMIPSFAKAYYKESTKPIFTFTIRPSKDKSFSCYDKKENSCYVELAEKNTIS